MRTTLDLDNAVMEGARSIAAQTGRSIGQIVSEFAKAGMAARSRTVRKKTGDFPTFKARPGARPIHPAIVKELIDDEGLPSRR